MEKVLKSSPDGYDRSYRTCVTERLVQATIVPTSVRPLIESANHRNDYDLLDFLQALMNKFDSCFDFDSRRIMKQAHNHLHLSGFFREHSINNGESSTEAGLDQIIIDLAQAIFEFCKWTYDASCIIGEVL